MINEKLIWKLKDLKVMISNKSESAEVQNLAFSMGIYWSNGLKKYMDFSRSSGTTSIIFRKKGENLVMLRSTPRSGDTIHIDEFRAFVKSFKSGDCDTSIPVCDTPSSDWKPKIGDKVICIKPDGYASSVRGSRLERNTWCHILQKHILGILRG